METERVADSNWLTGLHLHHFTFTASCSVASTHHTHVTEQTACEKACWWCFHYWSLCVASYRPREIEIRDLRTARFTLCVSNARKTWLNQLECNDKKHFLVQCLFPAVINKANQHEQHLRRNGTRHDPDGRAITLEQISAIPQSTHGNKSI